MIKQKLIHQNWENKQKRAEEKSLKTVIDTETHLFAHSGIS